ncbi:MAG TPA: hypothetical protein VFM65_09590 [Flavobacteriaceae bacterium]|nr:hypothetical protein [Flavobacteriaceae bacterium]
MSTIQRVEKEMPFHEAFVCFEDEEIQLSMQIQWDGSSTLVESIEFTLENKISKKRFELGEITSCENEEDGPFYRMNLVEKSEAPAQSTLEVDQNILGELDLKKSEHALFKFNCILPDEVEYYREHQCALKIGPPRNKDGTIIISI